MKFEYGNFLTYTSVDESILYCVCVCVCMRVLFLVFFIFKLGTWEFSWSEKKKITGKKSSKTQQSFGKYLWHLKFYKYAIYVLIHDSPIYFLRYVIQFKWLFNELLNVHGNNLYEKNLFISWQYYFFFIFPFILFDLVCHCVYQLMNFFFLSIWQTNERIKSMNWVSKKAVWSDKEKTNICSQAHVFNVWLNSNFEILCREYLVCRLSYMLSHTYY